MTFYGLQSFGAMPAGGYDAGMPGSLATMAGPAPVAMSPGRGAPPAVAGEALRQQAAALLQHCYRWLEVAVTIVPETADLASVLVTAVQQYEAQQYESCMAQIAAVIQAARQLRLAVPALPPL